MKSFLKSLVVSALIAAPALADTEEPVPTASTAHVISVRIAPVNGGINPNYVGGNVYATVQAGNACMMPKSFAKEIKSRGRTLNYRLIAIDLDRYCPMVLQPVVKEVLVDTLRMEFSLPNIVVNGVKAEAIQE